MSKQIFPIRVPTRNILRAPTRIQISEEVYKNLTTEAKQQEIDYKLLKSQNRLSYPRISVENVFFHKNIPISILRRGADIHIENDTFETLPIEYVSVLDIIPTQKFIQAGNIESVQDIGIYTDAWLIRYRDLFYIIDGHHRIASNILKGKSGIYAYVYDATNDDMSF